MSQALHFNTYGGNPMSCAVGSAVLDVIEEDKCQEISQDVGTYFMMELAKMRDEYDIIGDVRGKGLMIGIEMVTDKVCICLPHRVTERPLNGGHSLVRRFASLNIGLGLGLG